MRPLEWLLSAAFVAFLALKVAEGAWRIEIWPFTNVPMFAQRVPPGAAPLRVTLVGTRGGQRVAVGPADFGLTDDEFGRQVTVGSVWTLPARCGILGGHYNRTRPPALRLQALEAHVVRIPRPGVASEPYQQVVQCDLPEVP